MDHEDQCAIGLFFVDECGFNLTPSIPYGWIPTGEQRTIRSTKTLAANALGFLSRTGKLKMYLTKSTIDSDFVISCIDEVAQNIVRTTVLIMDNAPWHRSAKMSLKIEQW